MNAHVLNGTARGTALVNATAPTDVGMYNAAQLYEDAVTVLQAAKDESGISGWEGLPTEYAAMIRRAHNTVQAIGNTGYTMGELACIPINAAFWDDVSQMTENVVRKNDWLKDASRINPMLVPVRAAVISLTQANVGGIADMFAKANQNNLKVQWEANGGKWQTFADAIAQGVRDKPAGTNGIGNVHVADITSARSWLDAYGIGDGAVYYGPGGDPSTGYYMPGGAPSTGTPPPLATPPIQQQGGGSTFGGLWDLAAPLLNNLLGTATAAGGAALTELINPGSTQPPTPNPNIVATPPVQRPPARTPPHGGAGKGAMLTARKIEALHNTVQRRKTQKAVMIGAAGVGLFLLMQNRNGRKKGR